MGAVAGTPLSIMFTSPSLMQQVAKYGHFVVTDGKNDTTSAGYILSSFSLRTQEGSPYAALCGMFAHATSFNGDLSGWQVGQVTTLAGMFNGATSFDRQLDQAWATSTAHKNMMFNNCPGTIVGRTKLANGTIE